MTVRRLSGLSPRLARCLVAASAVTAAVAALSLAGGPAGAATPASAASGAAGSSAPSPASAPSGAAGSGAPSPASPASAASGAAGSGAPSPASGAATPTCQTRGLVIWINTQPNGTAGTTFFTLNFTNLSGHPCLLRGFPGVSAVNLRGRMFGRAAGRDSGQPVRDVTLTNHQTAHAILGIVDIGALPASTCPPTTAAGLRVFPPNQTTAKVVPFPFQACGRNGGPSVLRIRPVTR